MLEPFFWQELGPYSAYLGPFWAMLGHFGAILASCWAHVGPSWAILGYVSAFVLDLGISVSLNFRLMQRVCKKYHKYQGRNTILGSCWAILGYFVICVGLCFGFGHFSVVEFSSMQRGYACLISGLCWAIVGYVGTILGSCWAILVDFVVCVGLCWARVGTILGLSSHISVSLNFRPCNTFRKTSHKYQENNNFWGALLMVFAAVFLVVCVSFFWARCT